MTVVPLNQITGVDEADEAVSACAGGWMLDEDLWWTRATRDGDAPGNPEGGSVLDGRIYVDSASSALAYDRGERESGPNRGGVS